VVLLNSVIESPVVYGNSKCSRAEGIKRKESIKGGYDKRSK
jgi:hypothetical protein